MRACGLVLFTAALAAGAEPAKQAVKADRDKLQGTWAFVSIETDGKQNDKPPKGDQFVFKDDKISLTAGGMTQELTFDLSPGDDPKGIVLVPKEAPGVNYHLQGIYKLDGDELQICWALPVKEDMIGKVKPKQFKTQPGSFTVLVTLKRVKTGK